MASIESFQFTSCPRPKGVRLAMGLVVLALALTPLVGVPAQAESYTVTMANGTTFITRYQPVQADWDPSMALLMTDVGNWIAVPQADIVEVVAEFDRAGFGRRLDAKTVEIGYVANDEPVPDEDGAVGEQPPSALDQFLNRSYDVQQFVDPSEAGGGFPVGGFPVGAGSSGGGGGGGNNLNSSALPTPAQPAPSPTTSGSGGGS